MISPSIRETKSGAQGNKKRHPQPTKVQGAAHSKNTAVWDCMTNYSIRYHFRQVENGGKHDTYGKLGDSISDLEAYKKAVQFYFPGAVVNMQLTIDLIGTAAENDEPVRETEQLIPADLELLEEKSKILTLDLSSFF